jgi:signal transduction histidine kinase/CheY-like chemotaxis protein
MTTSFTARLRHVISFMRNTGTEGVRDKAVLKRIVLINLIILSLSTFALLTGAVLCLIKPKLTIDVPALVLLILAICPILLIGIAGRQYIKNIHLIGYQKGTNHFTMALVSHELRSPLNVIIQIGHLLKAEISNDDYLRKIEPLVDMTIAAGNNTRNIVNNVMSMARMESGIPETISPKTFLIAPFLTEIVGMNQVVAQAKHVRILLSIENMPAAIISDPLNLNHIITNLLVNAIKYSYKGGTVNIHVNKTAAEKWTIQIINRGSGIPVEKLATIFDPFDRCGNSNVEGTGLGLYIVRTKCASLNGSIQAESKRDGYVVFTVTLPLSEGNLRNVPKEEEAWDPEMTNVDNAHVLVAEDDNLASIVLRTSLNQMHCTVTRVGDGGKVVDAAERYAPDIIMMDYHMPVMNGAQAIRAIKNNPAIKDIPIIVTTGDIFSSSLEEMMIAGADNYIEKPFDEKILQKMISVYMRKKAKPSPVTHYGDYRSIG